MNVSFSVKQRTESGRWKLLDVGLVEGRTLREAFLSFDGSEVVAEFKLNEQRCFFVGTDFWLEKMAAKGQAMKFTSAVKHLERLNPRLLDKKIPDSDLVSGFFSVSEN